MTGGSYSFKCTPEPSGRIRLPKPLVNKLGTEVVIYLTHDASCEAYINDESLKLNTVSGIPYLEIHPKQVIDSLTPDLTGGSLVHSREVIVGQRLLRKDMISANIDEQQRIIIPLQARQFLSLCTEEEVTVNDMNGFAEIWKADTEPSEESYFKSL